MTKTEMIIAIVSQGFEVQQVWVRNEEAMALSLKLRAYPKRRKEGRVYQIENNICFSHILYWVNPDDAINTIETDLITSLYNAMKKEGEL